MVKLGDKIENLTAALERLSKREKAMVAGAVVAFVLFIGTLSTMWITSTLDSLEKRITTKTSKLKTIIDLRQEYQEAKTIQKSSMETIKKGRNIDLMATIDQLSKRLGIHIDDMKPSQSNIDKEAGVKEDRVEVNIRLITIDSLVEFLDEIEKKSKTVAIRKLRVKRRFQEPTDHLEVNMTVSNFQLLPDMNGERSKASAPKKAK